MLQWALPEQVLVGRGRVRRGGGHLEVLQWASQNGCEWDEETCSGSFGRPSGGVAVVASEQVPVGQYTCKYAAEEGTWRCCSGRVRTGARGTRGRAAAQRTGGIWKCWCGVRTGARGTTGRAITRREEATWRCCSGRVRTGASGTSTRARPAREVSGGSAVGASEQVPVGRHTCAL